MVRNGLQFTRMWRKNFSKFKKINVKNLSPVSRWERQQVLIVVILALAKNIERTTIEKIERNSLSQFCNHLTGHT